MSNKAKIYPPCAVCTSGFTDLEAMKTYPVDLWAGPAVVAIKVWLCEECRRKVEEPNDNERLMYLRHLRHVAELFFEQQTELPTWRALAEHLNREGLRTITGHIWTFSSAWQLCNDEGITRGRSPIAGAKVPIPIATDLGVAPEELR